MKKVIAYLTIIVFTSIYIVCSDTGLMKKVSDYKYQTNSFLQSDKYRYGDLFGMSYLRDYKEKRGIDELTIPIKKSPCDEKLNLYMVHDSYLEPDFLKSKDQLGCIDSLYDIKWWRDKTSPPIHLDTSRTNVLLFEIVERSLSTLDSAQILNFVSFDDKKPARKPNNRIISYVNRAKGILFNPQINDNLEFVVFATKVFTPFKEVKSSINYKIFNRTAPEVMVSSNKEYLFLSETATSVTSRIPDSEIERIVYLLNKAYTFYRKMGFKEVYFSIIPNPISIIEPESKSYNNFIPRIQLHEELKMPMVDAYSIFKSTGVQIYYHSDTHWNKNGLQLWLNEWNRKNMRVRHH